MNPFSVEIPGGRRPILVIGSVAWDEVVRLDAALRRGSHNAGAWTGLRIGGGAANTAMALARAGGRPQVVSAVGGDERGQRLIAELAGLDIDVSLISRHGGDTTRSLILLEAGGERTVVNLARAEVPLPEGLAQLTAACCYVRSADPNLTPVLARRVRHGLVVAHVPPVRDDFRPAQVLVGSASDLDERFMIDPFAAGQRIAGVALERVIITHGPDGAVAYGRSGVLEQPARAVRVVDSTGAGDVFAAGLVYALAAGTDLPRALATAVAWGSASVCYEGTVPPIGFPPRTC